MSSFKLSEKPVHLGQGAKATSEPTFTGMEWYQAYAQRHEGDGIEGRLVTSHHFESSWDVWELHPSGDEVVYCIDGQITLIQELNGTTKKTILNPGDYAINPKGVWHTADVEAPATALFITAGAGTENKPR